MIQTIQEIWPDWRRRDSCPAWVSRAFRPFRRRRFRVARELPPARPIATDASTRRCGAILVTDHGLAAEPHQDFTPGQDTQKTRRRLAGFDMGATAESFGIAADGSRLVIAASEQILSIAVAEGLTGIDSPLRASR